MSMNSNYASLHSRVAAVRHSRSEFSPLREEFSLDKTIDFDGHGGCLVDFGVKN